MCGLVAAFYPDHEEFPSPEPLETALRHSLEIITHRGPDSRGIYVSPDCRAGLGHVRLSIIDLPTGQQPLSDEEDLIHCVVTGEIYDHDRMRAELQSQGYSFKTKSDSELVVQLYKRDGFNLVMHLRGEFAFVLYDLKRRLLFAARNRFGIKPLYYTVYRGCVMFASEMKAFMGFGWKAEWDVESIVHNAEFSDERTVFRGVQKMLAGHFAICRASGHIQTQAYYDLNYPDASDAPTETIDEMIVKVRELLVESVRLRLRSDVPLAVYLSGGIDSSAVAGIATHLLRETDPSAKLTAFTLAYVEDPTTDESHLAERTAVHLDADLRKVKATEALLVNALEDAIWHAEQPTRTFHSAGKILLSKAVHDAGFKVALSGEGSDEIFGGYVWFLLDFLQDEDPAGAAMGLALPSPEERCEMVEAYQAATHMPLRTRSALAPEKSNAPRHLITTGSHLALKSFAMDNAAGLFHPRVRKLRGVPDMARCMEEGVDARVREKSVMGTWHSLHVSEYVIAKYLLGHTILNGVGDRGDMRHSVESRVSFLDHHVVDYVNKIPPSLKIKPVQDETSPGKWRLVEKWILREAVRPFITEDVYLRKKVAFNPPPAGPSTSTSDKTNALLPLQMLLKARLTQESVEQLGLFDWPFVSEQLQGYLTAPVYLSQGRMDPRGILLLNVLSFVVLQERFDVPTWS